MRVEEHAAAWTSGMGERERWQVAARWVESLKIDRLRETITALDRHLDATLPVEVRSALPHWIEAALAGDARGLLQLRLIRNLNPRSPQLGDAGLLALARRPELAALQRVKLYGHRLGDRAARALARSPAFARLCRLNLTHNEIGPDGALELVVAGPAGLDHLFLGRNRIGIEGALALAGRPEIRRLRVLDLRDNNLDQATQTQLMQHANLAGCELRVNNEPPDA